MGIRCVHYIEQKDCTAGLDAVGIWEILFTTVNQVYSSYSAAQTQLNRVEPLQVYSTYLLYGSQYPFPKIRQV